MRKGQALDQEELEALPVGARVTDWEYNILTKQEDGLFRHEDGETVTAHVLDQAYGMAHYYDAPDVGDEPVSREESMRLHPSNGATVLVFDGPPGHQSGRFIEAEDGNGRSIRAGEWHNRGDGTWELRLDPRVDPEAADRLHASDIIPVEPGDAGRLLYSVNVYENATVSVPGPTDRDHLKVARALRGRADSEQFHAAVGDPKLPGLGVRTVTREEAAQALGVIPVTREEAVQALGHWLTDEQVETRSPVAPPLPASRHAGLKDQD